MACPVEELLELRWCCFRCSCTFDTNKCTLHNGRVHSNVLPTGWHVSLCRSQVHRVTACACIPHVTRVHGPMHARGSAPSRGVHCTINSPLAPRQTPQGDHLAYSHRGLLRPCSQSIPVCKESSVATYRPLTEHCKASRLVLLVAVLKGYLCITFCLASL